MGKRFNRPPGWPTPPPGWLPPEGWEPPKDWGEPPAGWRKWIIEDGESEYLNGAKPAVPASKSSPTKSSRAPQVPPHPVAQTSNNVGLGPKGYYSDDQSPPIHKPKRSNQSRIIVGVGILVVLVVILIASLSSSPRTTAETTPKVSSTEETKLNLGLGSCLQGVNLNSERARFYEAECESAQADYIITQIVNKASECFNPPSTYNLVVTGGVACASPRSSIESTPIPTPSSPTRVKITTPVTGSVTRLSCWSVAKTAKGPKLTKRSCNSYKAKLIMSTIVSKPDECEIFTAYVLIRKGKVYCFNPKAN